MHPIRQMVVRSAAALLVLVGAACNDMGGPTGSGAQEALNQHRAVWRSIGLPDYDMQQLRSCECLPGTTGPMYIRVRDDAIANIWTLAAFEPVAEDRWHLFRDVEGLFTLIQQAIDDEVEVLEVEYDEEFGYPSSVLVDPSVNVGDDEVGYTSTVLIGTL